MLGDFSLSRKYPIFIKFKDVSGLPDKSVVKLSGVDVGKVKKISLDGNDVLVELAIDHGITIYRDSKFRIGSTSIIGSKFLDIEQGIPGAGSFRPGEMVSGDAALPIDRMLSQTLASVQKLLDDVNNNGSLAGNLNGTLANMRETTANMRDISIRLNDLIAQTQPHLARGMEKADDIAGKLDSILAKAETLMVQISTPQGTIGALLTDASMKSDIKETVSNLRDASGEAKTLLGRVNSFRTYWSFDYRYEPAALTSKVDIFLKIAPRDSYYYFLGGTNLANKQNALKGVDYEPQNSVAAGLGFIYGQLDVYGGVFRSAGAVGVNWRPFKGSSLPDMLVLNAEGSDFGRNRYIENKDFTKPRFDFAAGVKLHRMVSVGAKLTDVLELGRMEYGAQLTFEDKDLSYMLGLFTLGAKGQTGP